MNAAVFKEYGKLLERQAAIEAIGAVDVRNPTKMPHSAYSAYRRSLCLPPHRAAYYQQ
jgi:hypothetical protein